MRMTKLEYLGSSHPEYFKLLQNWQKTGINVLPNLFNCYDENSNESKRVVAYQLNKKSFTLIAKQEKKIKNLIVHMGAREFRTAALLDIPIVPFFQPILELSYEDGESAYGHFDWAPNPTFVNDATSVSSQADAIPGAGAYLFILSWLELRFNQLHEPFMSITNGKNQRVKSYVFQTGESKAIINEIVSEGRKVINLYLGNGIRVSAHPFSFRPILEVSSEEGNNFVNGSSYFDFCNPCPPYCND